MNTNRHIESDRTLDAVRNEFRVCLHAQLKNVLTSYPSCYRFFVCCTELSGTKPRWNFSYSPESWTHCKKLFFLFYSMFLYFCFLTQPSVSANAVYVVNLVKMFSSFACVFLSCNALSSQSRCTAQPQHFTELHFEWFHLSRTLFSAWHAHCTSREAQEQSSLQYQRPYRPAG